MTIEEMSIELIIPYENNPRNNKAAIPIVKKSIQEFGFKVPIIIDNKNVIVCGHTRYMAAQELGIETIPCVRADDLTPEQIKAFRIADNKAAEESTWDMEKLLQELEGIQELDMSMFGFDDSSIDDVQVVEDDFSEEELPEEPKSKRGELYQLGNHRLLCGDSTSEADVDRLMNGCIADLVVTDPPYNVNVSNSKGMKIENDNMEREQFKEFLRKAFFNLEKNLKVGGVLLCLVSSKRMDSIRRST